MVRLSPDGSRAYVTSRLGTGTLSVIFLNEDRDPVVIQTGPGAEGLDVSADGSEVWVANRQERSISVIDAELLEVVAGAVAERCVADQPVACQLSGGLDSALVAALAVVARFVWTRRSRLPWVEAEALETRALMGEDYWRYGVKECAHEIEALTRYSYDQGLSERKLTAEDLFAPSTFEISKI